MKKISSLILATALLLTGCKGSGEKILGGANTENSSLSVYIYDGNATETGWVFDGRQAVVDELNSIKLTKADTDISELTAPFYGVTCYSTEKEMEVGGVYSGGYWISTDGSVYKTSKNVEEILGRIEPSESYTFDGIAFPGIRHFAEDNDVWDTRFLNRAKELAPVGFALSIDAVESGSITCTLTNTTNEELCCGEYYALQAEVGGEWYDIPTIPQMVLEFCDIAHIVPAGEGIQLKYYTEPYGQLPSGKYRVVAENAAAEFTV